MKEVKLDEILFSELEKLRKKYPKENFYSEKQIRESPEFVYFVNAMKEACNQTLELAAENAYVQDWYMNGELVGKAVNKQSILDLINQIK